jgi:hypothetical protein
MLLVAQRSLFGTPKPHSGVFPVKSPNSIVNKIEGCKVGGRKETPAKI